MKFRKGDKVLFNNNTVKYDLTISNSVPLTVQGNNIWWVEESKYGYCEEYLTLVKKRDYNIII